VGGAENHAQPGGSGRAIKAKREVEAGGIGKIALRADCAAAGIQALIAHLIYHKHRFGNFIHVHSRRFHGEEFAPGAAGSSILRPVRPNAEGR